VDSTDRSCPPGDASTYSVSPRQRDDPVWLRRRARAAQRPKNGVEHRRRSAQRLDFSRSLISVETLICAGFWIALHPGEASRVWPLAAAIACGGFLLVGGLSWLLSRTRREMTGVESIASAMQSGE
jgi:hypothetical protein